MKHVILPYNAQQVLELIHQFKALIDVLHNDYQYDFIDIAEYVKSPLENQGESSNDSLDF